MTENKPESLPSSSATWIGVWENPETQQTVEYLCDNFHDDPKLVSKMSFQAGWQLGQEVVRTSQSAVTLTTESESAISNENKRWYEYYRGENQMLKKRVAELEAEIAELREALKGHDHE